MIASAAGRLGDAVAVWLDGLATEARSTALLPWDDALDGERRRWAYWPTDRRGLPLSAMTPESQQAAVDVLVLLLSQAGFAQAVAVMAFEDVLRRLEADGLRGRRRIDGLARDRLGYHLSAFGDPASAVDPWGVRFEGHHLSVHATVVGAALAIAPAFLGANPATVGALRPLGVEEDLGRLLARSLPAPLAAQAFLEGEAPDDIVTKAAPSVEPFDDATGVALADLGSGGEAHDLFIACARAHVGRLPAGEAAAWWAAIEPTESQLRFAWCGPTDLGAPHYFRLWHPRLLVEHDNTQNDADHAHNVVRDPAGDFGADLLRHHLADHPH